MIPDKQLKQYMNHWQAVYERSPRETLHLTNERIYELAEPGVLDSAPSAEIEHLSLCASCMKEWALWCQVQAEQPEFFEDDQPSAISGGMLKAAASPGEREALKLVSACGRFRLGMLPEMENPEKGLVTLETAADAVGKFNGNKVSIRDAKNRIILKGTIENDRIARPCKGFQEIDLSSWSIVIE